MLKNALTCKLSGLSLSLSAGNLALRDYDFIHPALTSKPISRALLELDIKSISPTDTTSLRLLYVNLIARHPVIIFKHPAIPSNETVLATYEVVKPILVWAKNLEANELKLLPKFSVTADSSSMTSFNRGFCEEIKGLLKRL